MAIDDYYRLLDVAPDAEREEIKGAYREKRDALQAGEGDDARAKVARLNRAWNVLSDPAQRERYDGRLAEEREAGDVEYDDDGDSDNNDRRSRSAPKRSSKSAPTTRAEQRAEARQARLERRPTIVLPEGVRMATVPARLAALGTDILIIVLIALSLYLVGLKYIDHKFPGVRQQRSALVTKEKKVIKDADAAKSKVSSAGKAVTAAKAKKDTAAERTATAALTKARAAETAANKQLDQLGAQVSKIDRKVNPSYYPFVALGLVLLLLYLIPGTALTGKTFGKKLRKIRVAHLDGSVPGWKTAIIHFGAPLLVGLFLGIFFRLGPLGLVVAVIGTVGWVSKPNRQGLHDRVAKTIVVEA